MKTTTPKLHSVKFKSGGYLKPVDFQPPKNTVLRKTNEFLDVIKKDDCVAVAMVVVSRDGFIRQHYSFLNGKRFALTGAIEDTKNMVLFDVSQEVI
jgi:hypothetical protein